MTGNQIFDRFMSESYSDISASGNSVYLSIIATHLPE
jgi:hypothetical protein